MATAQINARINADVKALGDRALDNIGYTPTKAIRALWKFAGEHVHDRRALQGLFDEMESRRETAKREENLTYWREKVEEGPRIVERALREMGIEDYTPPDFSNREVFDRLREEAMVDKMKERGLWHEPE